MIDHDIVLRSSTYDNSSSSELVSYHRLTKDTSMTFQVAQVMPGATAGYSLTGSRAWKATSSIAFLRRKTERTLGLG